MKINKLFFGLAAAALSMAGMMQSCMSEMPFGGDGEGTLRMKLVINSDLTRAEIQDDALRDSCVVYISRANGGLVQKYRGLDNVPPEILLKSGNYILEAWTGDSVPASFDKRFYRGYHAFSISDGDNTSVSLTCKIANVVVSLDTASVHLDEMPEWKLKVYNSSGDVTFTSENMEESAYFMMPNADIARDENGNIKKASDGWSFYTNLYYEIEGKTASGDTFTKSGPIGSELHGGDLVEHAHDYRLKFLYNPEYEQTGGSFITIKVIDSEIENAPYEFGIYSRPAITGYDFDIEEQVYAEENGFGETIVKVSGFGGIENLILSTPDYEIFNLPQEKINLPKLANSEIEAQIKNLGLDWTVTTDAKRDLTTYHIFFKGDFLNQLKERPEEYVINIQADDARGKSHSADLRFAVGAGAIVVNDPLTIDINAINSDYLAVRATSATISGILHNDEAVNPRIRYRELPGGGWNEVQVPLTRAGREFSVQITGLKPATTYELQCVADGFDTPKNSYQITTESKYSIPNGNMENWIVYDSKKYDVPAGDDGGKSFWDNGNKGASTVSLNNICAKTQEKVHNGSFAAKLETKNILTQLAAGNLFIGDFGSATISPLGAKLSFGKPYDGSHPEALRVWAHYTPAKVTKGGDKISTSEYDRGQIYVAIVNGPYSIDTGAKKYFDKDSDQVLGYGEFIWEGVGTSGDAMEELVIKINWKNSAKTVKGTHLVVVCSASMYGDFFQGGPGSVMYVDDFELVY